jgi:hypothetical protein
MQASEAACSMAYGGARPKVGRSKNRSSASKTAAAANLCQNASPPTRRLESYRGEERLHPLNSASYPPDEPETISVSGRLLPPPEELNFEVIPPPLRPRRTRELLRTNSSDSFLPAAREPASSVSDSSTCLFLDSSRGASDTKRSSFDEGRLLDGEGGAACSLPSITSSSMSIGEMRPDVTLSELDLYEAPEDDCYIYTYKVNAIKLNIKK